MNQIKGMLMTGCLLAAIGVSAQKRCTSDPGTLTADINFGSVTWQATNGATTQECNDMADGLITFTGNVIVDLANNTKLTITNDVNIDGDFPISGGSGSILSVNGGFTLHVTGDLGDPTNNGVQYEVVTSTDEIIVDGTLYGKNNNAFTGNGNISGGTLDVKNGSTCGDPCPVTGGFQNCTSGDSFCSTNSVLPITLLSFTGYADELNNQVNLQWSTVMEENFDRFIIERSADGNNFEGIGELKGQGRDLFNIESKYEYSDIVPQVGLNYYRLTALDIDGSSETFFTIAVRIDARKSVAVYPNPTPSSHVDFRMNFDPSLSDQILIINAMGEEFGSLPANSVRGRINFNTPLPSGIYFLIYKGERFGSTSRFVVH